MDTITKPERPLVFDAHRLEMIRLMEDIDAQTGIVGDPNMTAAQLRERQRARGVRAEDNVGSRELVRMRYGEDWEEGGEG